ncbi:hypothetical protein MKJ04_13050 [Pontibacter sp. E15-1]|uniref:hypothetical protein n=1 Tax=Pontibacter sp. E15-1 TaxID=2919918 RepID=UPI001F5001EA|nr:hypothetical protein [Pontibacter sp. E15-1]MCJ8165774.1 hypothetical protein [Pontibacter sp. E15-1]
MYINLYPNRQLQSTKKTVLGLGLFCATGGAYALMRELFWIHDFRVGWALSSALLTLVGFLSIAVAMDKIRLKDAYLSITPERIMYRLTLTGRERLIRWDNVQAMRMTEHVVIFDQKEGAPRRMRLGLIQQPEMALHVSRSLMLAAIEKGIPVNGKAARPELHA